MTNFLSNVNLLISLVVIVLCIGGYAYELYKKYKQQGKDAVIGGLREIAYELFLKAEKKYGPGTGSEKMASVVTAFYKIITKDKFAELLPDTTIEKFLQDVFDKGIEELKDYLDDGQMNNSSVKIENVQTSDQQNKIEQK